MKIKNLAFVPLIFFNCEQENPEIKKNINFIEEKIKKTFDKCENIKNLKFEDTIYNFSKVLDEKLIESFVLLAKNNKNSFNALFDYDFTSNQDIENAKNKFKELIKEFITLQKNKNCDHQELSFLILKINYLFQNLEIKNDSTFIAEVINPENENLITNLLNFIVSIYSKNILKRSFLKEKLNDNFIKSQTSYDRYKFTKLKGGEINISNIESEILNDEKVDYVLSLNQNQNLLLMSTDKKHKIYDIEKINNQTLSLEEAFEQIINLIVNIKEYISIPDFCIGKELIKIFKKIPDNSIDHATECDGLNVLQACCEILNEFTKNKKEEQLLNVENFKVFTSKLKESSIKISEQWDNIIFAFSEKKLESEKENYSSHIVKLFSGQVLNSKKLILKTLSLLQNKSLEQDYFENFTKIFATVDTFLRGKEISEEFFKKYDYDKLTKDTFSTFYSFFGKLNSFASPYNFDKDTFIGFILKLKNLSIFEDNKNKFNFEKEPGACFIHECEETEKKEVREYLKNKGISINF